MLYEDLVGSMGEDERFSIDQPPPGGLTHKISVTSGDLSTERFVTAGQFAVRYPDRIIDEVQSMLEGLRKTRLDKAAELEKVSLLKRAWRFMTGGR